MAAALLLGVVGFTAWDYIRVSQIYVDYARRLPAYQNNTLAKAQESTLFASQASFARLTLTPLTPATARDIHAVALQLLHFAPEPRVVSKLIDSARMLGLDDEAAYYSLRFERAFPVEFKRWRAKQAPTPPAMTERLD